MFPEQLAHGLWAGGGAAGLRDLVESYPNAILRRLSLAPTPLAALCVLAYVALVLAAARGFRRARAEAPATAVVLAGQVVLLPLWAAVLSHVVARSGFAPNYLAASGLALCVLAAVSLARAKRSGAVLGLLLLPLLAHAALVARSPGAEDYVGAAREALRRARANVPIAPIEWQPDLFPRAQGFLWSFERLGGVPDGVQVVLHDGDYGLATALDAQERAGTELHGLVVVVRGLPQGDDLWRRLEERFGAPEVVRFGVVRLVAYGAARTIGDDAR
ncbi:MAG: hypothetical protein R3F34_02350 [Planctomycetota bacterium]